jgi:ATP-dependent exoDNAse (exonuclease V) beta subunit
MSSVGLHAFRRFEHPDDDLNLYATLRGSLFAIEDADLFAYKAKHRWLSYTNIPAEQDEELTSRGYRTQ